MPDSSDARAQDVLETAERILTESMVNYGRLLAADLSVLPVAEQAFDLGVDAYDTVLSPNEFRLASDAELTALEAFLDTYLREAGRS